MGSRHAIILAGVTQHELLLWLLDRDSPRFLVLGSDAPASVEAAPELVGREVDDALRQAEADGHLRGERKPRESFVVWSDLRVTAEGLRDLGQWPPAGHEYLEGPWDGRRWGIDAKPLLEDLARRLPESNFFLRPLEADGSDEWERWDDLLRLMESGLVEGVLGKDGLNDLRLTRRGQTALEPPNDDPLARARAHLQRGSKADAVTAAVEEALKACLRGVAEAHNMAWKLPDDKPKRLSQLNDALKSEGVYAEPYAAEVRWWLAVRNEVDHGRGSAITERRIRRMIEGIEEFIDEMGGR